MKTFGKVLAWLGLALIVLGDVIWVLDLFAPTPHTSQGYPLMDFTPLGCLFLFVLGFIPMLLGGFILLGSGDRHKSIALAYIVTGTVHMIATLPSTIIRLEGDGIFLIASLVPGLAVILLGILILKIEGGEEPLICNINPFTAVLNQPVIFFIKMQTKIKLLDITISDSDNTIIKSYEHLSPGSPLRTYHKGEWSWTETFTYGKPGTWSIKLKCRGNSGQIEITSWNFVLKLDQMKSNP